MSRSAWRAPADEIGALVSSVHALQDTAASLRSELATLSATLDLVRSQASEALTEQRRQIAERAALAAVAGTRLLADGLAVTGAPSARAAIRRYRVDPPVERRFAPWQGLQRCVSSAPDVRDAWSGLMLREAASDGTLRGLGSTILDIANARMTAASGTFRVEAGAAHDLRDRALLAIPRFTHATAPRKLRNFSHWLLDCLPQVLSLRRLAVEAPVLLPPNLSAAQRASLELIGVATTDIVPWDGLPTTSGRALVFESDGRPGGGRPWSPLLEMRRALAPPGAGAGHRRIYISRRDAKAKRQWADNGSEVEALFADRGFEILCPTEYTLNEVAARFREARVVAGLNGAGLAHVLFAPAGAHLIVLLTDSLVRWYADKEGARSLWESGEQRVHADLTPLGDSPRFYAHVAAAFDQHSHAFVSSDLVPLDQLTSFLDDVLRAIGQ